MTIDPELIKHEIAWNLQTLQALLPPHLKASIVIRDPAKPEHCQVYGTDDGLRWMLAKQKPPA